MNNTLSSAEIEFLSEFEMVEIVPLEPIPLLKTLYGNYGPYKPPFKSSMPLWIAKFLYKKSKIQISSPIILQDLNASLLQEKSEISFSALPFHYIEMSKLSLDPQVSATVQDIWEIRERKIQSGLLSLDAYYLQVIRVTLLIIIDG
jgi:GINS complex subunit 2